jgi:hypothetical protein
MWLGVTAFLPDGSDYSIATMVERLRMVLPACAVGTHPHGVEVAGDGWRLWLYESTARLGDRDWAEFAEMFASHRRSSEMAEPGRRLEFAGREVDAGEVGGPAVVTVAEVLARFRGAFVFDSEAEEEL